ncbi:TIGR02186 family protein [Brevundimonas sp. LF-1]|uniref:TIGR02186 family protein n=1 Tax=Brevundimonas sp. LF-1 TaxID=3126100 RepID=UPI0030DFD07F
MFQVLPPEPPPQAAPEIIIERSAATTEEVRVAAALTDARVDVDSGFKGASIVLYGAVFNPSATPADVVVVVRGPDAPVRLVKKTRNMGVWLNSRPVLFEGAPGFYMTASTRPLSDIADFGQLRRLGVGVDHLRIDAPEEARTVTRYGVRDVVISRLGEDYLDWRRAVIRLKEAAALYDTDPKGCSSSTGACSAPRSNCPPWRRPGNTTPRSGCFRRGRRCRCPT